MSDQLALARRASLLDEEQNKALLLIASGAPMQDCLDALTEVASRLAPGARACVLLADLDLQVMGDGYSSHFPPCFTEAIRGLPIGEALIGTCGTAIYEGRPIACADIAGSTQWAPPWRTLCLENGILACHSQPAVGQGGRVVGSFFLCLSEARDPDEWERRIAEFGALATSIVVERDRAAAHLRDEIFALSRLQALSAELVGPGEFEPLLQKILAAAADITGTDKGNIQLFDPVRQRLRIVVHQGLGPRLVEHFLEDGWNATCGEAARLVQRFVVPDVEKLDATHDALDREVVLEDGIRSIQCTPLVSRDGRLLGMLNNHYPWTGGPTPAALRYIDLLARQAAELLERQQVEQELALERRRKDEFLALLSHELRNPLASLCNMLEVQQRAGAHDKSSAKALDVMERQLAQLMRLVDDLLDVNRINQGKLEIRQEALSLALVIQQAVETCRPMLDQRGHRLFISLPESPVRLTGDAARLAQVFGNLLTNACKYTPPGGYIEVSVEPAAAYVDVVVQDNGAGIPPDQIDEIFEMFTQVDQTVAHAQGGLGIGLMLVRQLIVMHGGSVHARSAGLGKGSEFTVRLPLPATRTDEPAEQGIGPAVAPRRILVVDDNQDVAQSLASLLEFGGHQLHLAYSGEEALSVGAQVRPEVVLMDIGMPGMNGHEACRLIRQSEWGRHALLVALTGWGQEHDRQLSEQAGFDAHLVKPVQFAKFQALFAEVERPGKARTPG